MPWRFRLYRWYRASPAWGFRWLVVNFLVFVAFGFVGFGADLAFGSLEYRWGLVVFMSFLTGFTAVAVLNIVMELLGLGYQEWRAQRGEE